MSQAAAALLVEFEDAAERAQKDEKELRRKMADEIALLARRRAFAYRRARLIRALAAVRDVDPKVAADAQRMAVSRELGWSGESKTEIAILDKLEPVGHAVWRCACSLEDATADDVMTELEAFETWFERAHGKAFYALFDQYVSEVPVVDF